MCYLSIETISNGLTNYNKTHHVNSSSIDINEKLIKTKIITIILDMPS